MFMPSFDRVFQCFAYSPSLSLDGVTRFLIKVRPFSRGKKNYTGNIDCLRKHSGIIRPVRSLSGIHSAVCSPRNIVRTPSPTWRDRSTARKSRWSAHGLFCFTDNWRTSVKHGLRDGVVYLYIILKCDITNPDADSRVTTVPFAEI